MSTATAEENGSGDGKALSFSMKELSGKPVDLKKYQGKVVLFVNVASFCGYTKQYSGLEALFEKYKDKGLVVIGVPCNQFGSQEPGSATEIAEFCQKNYGVTFDMLEKVDVNGDKACDLYKYLTNVETNRKGKGKVSWNFEKFLVDRTGQVVGRYGSGVEPDSKELTEAVEKALGGSVTGDCRDGP
ncbi:MAG: glutathione peroxidase [Pirellulales bacterium]